MKKFSVLELLHPDGITRTSSVLGMNCPKILCPEFQMKADGNTDLFVLAPSAKECNEDGWLVTAVQSLSRSISDDGIAYVFVPPRWRWKVMSLLHDAGLIMGPSFWHFPDWSSSRYMVPMEHHPVQFTLDAILSVSPTKRFLARQMFRITGVRWFLTAFWKPVAITVRRPGARPLFEWLFQDGHSDVPPTGAILRTSWRGEDGASIVYGIPGNRDFPTVIAKTVSAGTAASPNREAEALKNLGDRIRRTDVQVPKVIGRWENERRSFLLLSYVPGRSVSDLLESKAGRFSPIMTRVVDWLENWNRLTAVVRPLERDLFEQALLIPVDQLSSSIQGAEKYRSWLVARSQLVEGNPVPLVAAHNDLTMSNILLDDHEQLGVVDWETACLENLPLMDYYYAITDAVRISIKSRDWLTAFKACYLPEGSYNVAVTAWQEQLRSAIQLPAGLAELCFHACWLHHASNEHRTVRPGEPRPFLEIVQWMALNESYSLGNAT